MALPMPTAEQLFPAGGHLIRALNGINEYQINKANAQYAPETAYSNALSKMAYAKYLPYQLQSQMLSNPMIYYAFKDHPEELQKMMSSFSQSIPGGGTVGGASNDLMNMPKSGSNGLMGMLINKLSGNSNNAMNQGGANDNGVTSGNALMQSPVSSNPPMGEPATGSSMVPASQGGMGGVTGKMMAPYETSPRTPGVPYFDSKTGQIISAPSVRTSAVVQQQLLGAQRVQPQLERIANEWSPFLDLKGKAQLQGARIGNLVGSSVSPETLKSFGLSPSSDLPSRYAKAMATTKTAPEALVKAYGINPTNETLNRLQEVIEPLVGENKEGYTHRIQQELAEIKQEQEALSAKALSSGFNVTPGQNQEQQPNKFQRQSDDNLPSDFGTEKKEKGMIYLEGGLQVPESFPSKEAFHAWFRAQPKATQLAYKEHLKGIQ